MAKIFSSILFFILFINGMVQDLPLMTNNQDDIMVASSYLHRGAHRFLQHTNSMPNIRKFPSHNLIPYYQPNRNNMIPRQAEEEPETVYVNLKIDSDEVPETQYVNLFINTKQNK